MRVHSYSYVLLYSDVGAVHGQPLAKCAKGEQERTKGDGDGVVSATCHASLQPKPVVP